MLAISHFNYENEEPVSIIISQIRYISQLLKLGQGNDAQLLFSLENCVILLRSKIGGKYDDRFKGVPLQSKFLNTEEYQQELADLRMDLPPLSPLNEE